MSTSTKSQAAKISPLTDSVLDEPCKCNYIENERQYLDALRQGVGLPCRGKQNPLSYSELVATEWSPEFERLMRNRLILGAMRYGRLFQPGKPNWDRIASAYKRLGLYEEDGRAEHLVDVANLCLLQYVEGTHTGFYSESDHHTTEKE